MVVSEEEMLKENEESFEKHWKELKYKPFFNRGRCKVIASIFYLCGKVDGAQYIKEMLEKKHKREDDATEKVNALRKKVDKGEVNLEKYEEMGEDFQNEKDN